MLQRYLIITSLVRWPDGDEPSIIGTDEVTCTQAEIEDLRQKLEQMYKWASDGNDSCYFVEIQEAPASSTTARVLAEAITRVKTEYLIDPAEMPANYGEEGP